MQSRGPDPRPEACYRARAGLSDNVDGPLLSWGLPRWTVAVVAGSRGTTAVNRLLLAPGTSSLAASPADGALLERQSRAGVVTPTQRRPDVAVHVLGYSIFLADVAVSPGERGSAMAALGGCCCSGFARRRCSGEGRRDLNYSNVCSILEVWEQRSRRSRRSSQNGGTG